MSAALARHRGPALAVGVVVCTALALALAEPGWWTGLQAWIRLQQMALQGELGTATRESGAASPGAALALVGLSFLYGVFHAAGPGHGKAVIATYAAATRATVARVARLSFLASLAQALAAITLVYGALSVLELSSRWTTRTAETVLAPASYGAIAVLGAYLAWRGLAIWREAAGFVRGHHHHDHDHGHSHAPDPAALAALSGWRAQAAAIAAIGLRPCSGALIVLAVAWGVGALWIGAVAAIAMGVGTGMTVAALALLAVGARELALRLTVFDTGSVGRAAGLAAVAGGTAIACFALAMLAETLSRPAHPFLG